jgi:anaerobic selenocysteine-containing dehydrogenase
VVRQRPAQGAQQQERDGVSILAALAQEFGGVPDIHSQADAGAELATRTGYPAWNAVNPREVRIIEDREYTARPQAVAAGTIEGDGLRVFTSRSLYTSWEGASIRSEEADKLHREEAAWLHPADAEAAGVRAGEAIALSDGTREVTIAVRLDDGVLPGTVYVPLYFDGGAVLSLFPLEGAAAATGVRVHVLQPA